MSAQVKVKTRCALGRFRFHRKFSSVPTKHRCFRCGPPPRARGRTFGFPDAPAPSMGIRARRLRRRKAGGLHGAPGFEGAFEDDEDFVSCKPTSSRYAEHRAFVERESARRRRKGAAMDWLIVLVGFLISALATGVAFVVHLVFPVKETPGRPRNEEGRGDDSGGGGTSRRSDDLDDSENLIDDETRAAFAALHLDPAAADVTVEDVAAAYRRLARKHHPDKNGGSEVSSAAMQRVNAARHVCVAEVKRRRRKKTNDASRRTTRAYGSEDTNGGGWSHPSFSRGDESGGSRDEDVRTEKEEEDARDVSRGKKKTREAADGAFEEARRLERLRARRAFIERFLEISTRRDRRARSRGRATFGAAVAFVVAAVLAVHFYSRRADATSVAAEWLATGIVVALGALAAATH